ncbi:hypothetical protein ACFVX6_37385 [Streptomyces sp. NPDC058289]|uniref:hypothetical protein n=1 Tax=Streptomyces sp. NPDC058289 TaxID=3346425 RepID=UPI0036E98992
MAYDIVFFLAADDENAAATGLRGPGDTFESVTCHFIEPDSAIAEWDMYFQKPSAEAPPVEQLLGWAWPKWVTAPLNDGVEVFALPKRLTRALASASSAELKELAGRWTTRLRSEDGDDMTDDDLLAVLQGVDRLAASAVNMGGGLYSWSFRPSLREGRSFLTPLHARSSVPVASKYRVKNQDRSAATMLPVRSCFGVTWVLVLGGHAVTVEIERRRCYRIRRDLRRALRRRRS